MTLDPILTASLPIQIHVASAICAVILGPIALLRRSRDIWHRRFGKAWVVVMFMTAASSFAISEFRVFGPFGPFGPIHMLSCLTIYGLWQSVKAARGGNIARHQAEMRNLYFWAIGIAGIFTFLPGRRMNRAFFESAPQLGFGLVLVLISGGLAVYFVHSRKALR